MTQTKKFPLFSRKQSFGKVSKNLELWNILWHLKNVNYICISNLFCLWQRNQRIRNEVVTQKCSFSDLLEHGSFPSARPGSPFRVCISRSQEFSTIINHFTSCFQIYSLPQVLNTRHYPSECQKQNSSVKMKGLQASSFSCD